MPIRRATASAPELPGTPRCSLNVGSSLARSNPTDAFANRPAPAPAAAPSPPIAAPSVFSRS